MLTGVFRDRTRLQRLAAGTAHQALAQLIFSRTLLPHRPVRQCGIGPFVVEYVFRSRSLVVELEPIEPGAAARSAARQALLAELGFTVMLIPRREVRLQPQRVLDRIRAALR